MGVAAARTGAPALAGELFRRFGLASGIGGVGEATLFTILKLPRLKTPRTGYPDGVSDLSASARSRANNCDTGMVPSRLGICCRRVFVAGGAAKI